MDERYWQLRWMRHPALLLPVALEVNSPGKIQQLLICTIPAYLNMTPGDGIQI
jgi:hypothetical protein